VRLFFRISLIIIFGLLMYWAGSVDVLNLRERPLALHSPAFENNAFIPSRYSFEGENISPPLRWEGGPKGIKSYALMMIDYDATAHRGDPVEHWAVYNISSSVDELPTNAQHLLVGTNGYGDAVYRGMNPPEGGAAQNYHFFLFALDVASLDVQDAPTHNQLMDALSGHIVAKSFLVGRYQR
jgi:Raf kinase inhibitor-like YbhB/YbcL family protein